MTFYSHNKTEVMLEKKTQQSQTSSNFSPIWCNPSYLLFILLIIIKYIFYISDVKCCHYIVTLLNIKMESPKLNKDDKLFMTKVEFISS